MSHELRTPLNAIIGVSEMLREDAEAAKQTLSRSIACWARRGISSLSSTISSTCPWRIRKLRRDRHLEQTAAMVPPCLAVKDGRGGRRLA
jgi:signal transduction histidine kinase